MKKQIRSAADLAINGAQPAFVEPLHVGRPNIGSRETFRALTDDMFERRWFTNGGPLVLQFESEIAQRHRVKHCVAVCNGTIALEIAIRALGLSGEVIVPSFTFVATAHALHWQGLSPVFADIDPQTHNVDPDSVRRLIGPRTSGIIAVHLWGRAAPVEELQALADEHELHLMFDAAHAFDCTHKLKPIGGFGRCEVFSFHATKFFNTFEGGAILTDDGELADRMRLMRNFGFAGLDQVVHPGTNGKMAEICAAMGLTNLDDLASIVDINRRNYLAYQEVLGSLPGLELLRYDEIEKNNYQYVVVEIGKHCPLSRDELMEVLRRENVLARRYFWPCCHRMEPYDSLATLRADSLEVTESVSANVLVLPTGTSVGGEEIQLIGDILDVACRG